MIFWGAGRKGGEIFILFILILIWFDEFYDFSMSFSNWFSQDYLFYFWTLSKEKAERVRVLTFVRLINVNLLNKLSSSFFIWNNGSNTVINILGIRQCWSFIRFQPFFRSAFEQVETSLKASAIWPKSFKFRAQNHSESNFVSKRKTDNL